MRHTTIFAFCLVLVLGGCGQMLGQMVSRGIGNAVGGSVLGGLDNATTNLANKAKVNTPEG